MWVTDLGIGDGEVIFEGGRSELEDGQSEPDTDHNDRGRHELEHHQIHHLVDGHMHKLQLCTFKTQINSSKLLF